MTFKPYVPQYKEMNLQPMRYPARQVPPAEPAPNFFGFNKKREAQSSIPPTNVPYAEIGHKPHSTQALNVGNNIENGWTTAKNLTPNAFETVEQSVPFNPNQPMIDNNDYHIDFNTPIPSRPPLKVESPPVKSGVPNIGEYVLVLNDEVVFMGTTEAVEEQLLSLAFDQDFKMEDLVVMKRVGVKLGAFVSE
jgi:hypothetical protein